MKISILTPSYNTGKYLERAIQSVMAQNYDNWEHIIVDGGSTDNTLEILKKYPHVQWVSEPDKGQSDAMNKAFQMCSGDILTYLNADDFFAEGVFEYAIKYFEENPKTDFLVGGLHTRRDGIDTLRENISVKYDEISKLKYWFPLNPVSYLYKRNVQEFIGDFPIDEHFAMDYWFLLRACYFFNIQQTSFLFGVFDQTGENKTSQIGDYTENLQMLSLGFVKELGTYQFLKLYMYFLIKKLFPKNISISSIRDKLQLRTRLKGLISVKNKHF